jgi:nucleotide-binding universal stress UspA family protein
MVVQLAWSLAEMLEGELRIGHAWALHGEATLRSSRYLRTSSEELNRLVAEERRKRRRLLAGLAARMVPESMPCKLHMAKGDPRTALPRLVARHRPEVIVMGTVGRTGIAGLFIGNTAETVLTQVTCSVLAVKPEGFVSPVTP